MIYALDKIDDLSKAEVRERLLHNVRIASKGPLWLVPLLPLIFVGIAFIAYVLTDNAFLVCTNIFIASFMMVRSERTHYYRLILKLTAPADGEQDE